jgi:hypothetical protein
MGREEQSQKSDSKYDIWRDSCRWGRGVDKVSETVNSLVCQPWRDICWRAVPLVGNKYLVDEVGAKVNASACKACVGERWGRTPFCGEGRNIRGNNGWGGSTSGGRRSHAGRGRGRGGLRGVFETAPHERRWSVGG